MDKQLRQTLLFLQFYFAPWGAAKGEVWEGLFSSWDISPQSAYMIASRILTGEIVLSVEEIKLLKIITA